MDTPQVKFTFNKRGLSHEEFEEALTSKVDELLKNVQPELKRDKGTCIAKVKEAALQEIKGNQRQGSLFDFYFNTTRGRHMANSSGIRGTRRTGRGYRNNIKEYHKRQQDLFELLKIKFPWLFHGIQIGTNGDNIGYLLHGYGATFTASKFCDKVDEITKEYIQKLSQTPSEIEWEKESLERVVSLCSSIMMLRFANDMCKPNDLMEKKEYMQWKEHLWVLISFGALCVILEMLLLRIKQKLQTFNIIFIICVPIIYWLLSYRFFSRPTR